MNTYLRKIRKNSKALSPVVASIILIAVTVAVSVVVAAWMGGMTIGLMGNAEQVQVSNAITTADDTVILTVRNTGGATVTISDTQATVDGVAVDDIVGTGTGTTTFDVPKGTSADFTLTLASAMSAGAQYNVKLVTAKGTTIPYTITYNP
jgi:archaeal type IV pilus assembly protein PilA